MRRLRKVIEQWFRSPVFKPKPTKKQVDYRQRACEVRHQRRSLAKSRRRQTRNAALNEYGHR